MSLATTFLFITEITNPISILACIWLFYSYIRMPNKTLGAKMIVVLSASDFVFHVMTMLTIFLINSKLIIITATVVGVAVRFSVFWTCNIAILLNKLLSMKEMTNLKNYFNCTFISILILSLILSLL